MMSQLGHVMVGVADNVMVGKLGAVPLAAASLANVFFHLLLSVGIGISYGITPFIAHADGENDTSKSGSILKNGLFINVIVGIAIVILVISISPLLTKINQPMDVAEMAIPYLQLITFSLFPLMIFQTFRQFAEGLSLTKQAMWVVVFMNILNIILNYIFIFGKLGVAPMGLIGAGVATLISRVAMAFFMWGYVFFWPRFKDYWSGFREAIISKIDLTKILKVGVGAGAQFLFEVGAFGFAAIMIGWMGTNQLAAHQIAINLASISYMMASRYAATLVTL